MKEVLPSIEWGVGVLLALCVGLTGHFLHSYLPSSLASSMGDAVVALAIGLLLGNLVQGLKKYSSGYIFCLNKLLRTAIILLGLKISLKQIISLGLPAIVVISLIMSFALLVTRFVGKMAGLPPKLATLIGIGTAVCGNTAIAATAPAIGASNTEMSFAIATNTLFGTVAVFLYPLFAQSLGLTDNFFGAWAGLAINDTTQVIAASFGYSEAAGLIATTIKLTRNSMMGIAIVIATFLHRSELPASKEEKCTFLQRLRIPTFVLIFVLVVLLNSLGFFEFVAGDSYNQLVKGANWVINFFILVALAAVGLNTNLKGLNRIGIKPFLVGFAVASATSMIAFLVISYGVFQTVGT